MISSQQAPASLAPGAVQPKDAHVVDLVDSDEDVHGANENVCWNGVPHKKESTEPTKPGRLQKELSVRF